MASSSNSSTALVPLPRRYCYDVFVTFRGEDTRNNFTGFLFDALEKKGIYAFRDDRNLPKGESIGPELLRAIEGSQVFVAVFSRNYASSTWCLQELEKICECIKGSGKYVLPIFYDVDPSEVRKQSGIYCDDFVKHEKRFKQDYQKVSRWREALGQVGSNSGWDLREKKQEVECENIVQRILNILKCNTSFISKDLVGLNSRIEALENQLLLDSVDSVRVIGIWGMGGIGKTTLAMNLYGEISHRFEVSCFVDDVSKIFRLHDSPLDAQKQILFQTLGIDHHKIDNRYIATGYIRRLWHKRALVILDNVDQVKQLEKIGVDPECLGAGSRFVIISRDEHILKEYGVDVVYEVPLLNWTESHMLFCRKAFKDEKIIMSNYQNLANEILYYANGLPLAITVLGSFLFGRNVTEWKSALARLRESPDKDIMDVLQLSYDGLKETEKEIFLDIACFFNSRNKKFIENILNCCGFHADIGVRVLIEKSLISIVNSMIEMHSLLEELGRKIVQDNSSKEQRKWSRMWSKKQLSNVTLENMEKHVEAVVFFGGIDKNVEFLSKMSILRLLIIRHDEYNMINNYELVMSNKLRYVQWTGYPFEHLPSSFQPNELVELILVRSGIRQLWKYKKYLPNLIRLDLSDSKKLEKILDFGEFPNLESLNLERCINLVKLDPSIGLLKKLVYLNVKGCYNLVSIPNNIFGLSSLEYLNMSGCSKLMKPGTSHCRSTSSVFKWLIFPNNASFSAPITHAYMLPCFRILYCLRNVDISFCHLSHVPDAIECLNWLERLNLGGNNFVALPSMRKLSRLVYLNLEHCKLLESLPQLPFPSTIGPDYHENNEYYCTTGLVIFNCPKLGERECCSSITFSWMTQFIQANQQSYGPILYNLQIVTPGSEIPSWIKNKSKGGSILINKPPIIHDNKNNIIGFVCCALFCMAPQDQTMIECLPLSIYMKMSDERNCTKFPVIIDRDLIPTKSSHLWLVYFPREYYDVFGTIRVYCTSYGREVVGMDVKCCGYRWVCKQDLQEFNLTKKVLTAASATETVGLQLLLQNQILHQVHLLHKKQKKDVTEENNQVPSSESPATEEVQEQTPVSAQVEDEAVAIASETNSSLSNSNGQTGITASDEGLSKATISPALVKQFETKQKLE